MKLAQSGLLICTTLTLAACGSAPERREEARSTPAPIVEARSVQLEAGIQQPVAPALSQAAPAAAAPAAAPAPAPLAQQPGRGAYLEGDGPGDNAPANLEATPDAVPRAEPLHPYANRPYVALGQNFTPLTAPGNYKKRGIASWYGKKFQGWGTSSGEVYNMYAMTAAHPILPIPSYARITNTATKKSVVVRINDRGPFLRDRIIDLSYTAAYKLGIVNNGSGEVEVESLVPTGAAPAPKIAERIKMEPLPSTPVASTPSAGNVPAAAGKVYLQIGAFKSQQGAEGFLTRMRVEFESSGKQVVLYPKGGLVRVHVGPYANQDAARAAAEKIQARLGFKPIVSLH